jgi:excisionase family DNA binding protein
MEKRKFYSIPQVANLLEVSPLTIRRLIWKGKLESVKVGKSIRVSNEQLDSYINKGSTDNQEQPKRERFSIQGMFEGGDPIPKEVIDEAVKEWNKVKELQ